MTSESRTPMIELSDPNQSYRDKLLEAYNMDSGSESESEH